MWKNISPISCKISYGIAKLAVELITQYKSKKNLEIPWLPHFWRLRKLRDKKVSDYHTCVSLYQNVEPWIRVPLVTNSIFSTRYVQMWRKWSQHMWVVEYYQLKKVNGFFKNQVHQKMFLRFSGFRDILFLISNFGKNVFWDKKHFS